MMNCCCGLACCGSPAGINLDIFTLLAVSNSALGHVLAGGLAAVQQGPPGPPERGFPMFSILMPRLGSLRCIYEMMVATAR